MIARAAVLAILAAGCSEVYGIGEATLVPQDPDGDGVTSDTDNCPDVANPDQADADGDKLGDACDLCPGLASSNNHDEDGDRSGDVCDSCPGTPSTAADDDRDGIGNACDVVSPSQGHRLLFDPFAAPMLELGWKADQVAWLQSGDAVTPVAAPPGGDRGLSRPDVVVSGTLSSVEIGVLVPNDLQPGQFVGIELDDTQGGLPVSATIEAQDVSGLYGLRVHVQGASDMITQMTLEPGQARLRLEAYPAPGYTCVHAYVEGSSSADIGSCGTDANRMFTPALVTDVVTQFTFLDAIAQ